MTLLCACGTHFESSPRKGRIWIVCESCRVWLSDPDFERSAPCWWPGPLRLAKT